MYVHTNDVNFVFILEANTGSNHHCVEKTVALTANAAFVVQEAAGQFYTLKCLSAHFYILPTITERISINRINLRYKSCVSS